MALKYRDYSNTQAQDRDMNHNIMNHIFDLGGPVPTKAPMAAQDPCIPQFKSFIPHVNQVEKPQAMSQSFLRMKQSQEYEDLMENPTVNQVAIAKLKKQQLQESMQVQQLASQMQFQHASKYHHLKYMSPETLNRHYGRPINESVLSPVVGEPQTGDVFEQTSYHRQRNQGKERMLQQQLSSRHQQILAQPKTKGIQSYDGTTFNSLESAYNSI